MWYNRAKIDEWKRAAARRTVAESEREIERLLRVAECERQTTITFAARVAEAMEGRDDTD